MNGQAVDRGSGSLIMIVSEAATLARIEPFWSWNTPIGWTGFILFADGIVYRARGNSWIRSPARVRVAGPRVDSALARVRVLQPVHRNWHYVGLPENRWLRMFGYAWSFATIWPAIFEGAELIAVLRESRGPGGVASGRAKPPVCPSDPTCPTCPACPPCLCDRRRRAHAGVAVFRRAVCRALPGGAGVARVHLSARSDQRPSRRRVAARRAQRDRLINLAWSGLLCGVLWEFWNFWSRAKWHYTVPIMEDLKIFEMPVPGYLGFPAFALECFTMYVFVRALAWRVYAGSDGQSGTRCEPSPCDHSRARTHGGPGYAPPSADRRPRQAGDPGRRRADDPAHHQLARRARRHRPRPQPASPPGNADRGRRRRRRSRPCACGIRGSRASSAAPAGRDRRCRSSPRIRFSSSTATRSPTSTSRCWRLHTTHRTPSSRWRWCPIASSIGTAACSSTRRAASPDS